MTILHVMPNVSRAFGGPTESLIGYAQAAREQGFHVEVAAPVVEAEDRIWLSNELPDVAFHFFSSIGRHAWVLSPALWYWVWQHGGKYDAIHIHGLFNPISSLSARIAVSRGYPTVMRPFGTLSRYTFSRRSTLKQVYFRLLDRPALQQASVHFTTAAEREEACRLPLHLNGRTHIVPPPWRSEVTAGTMDEKAASPTALFLSRLHPKKNVSGLLQAWRHVVDTTPTAQLWIAGDGRDDYVRRMKDRTHTLGLGDHVQFLGFVQGDEKERVLREAWTFVLPSHQENFGVAVLEAVAHGLPVVISPEVQLADFIQNHDLGIVVERDIQRIARSLCSVFDNPQDRKRIGREGPKAVQDVFGLDVVGRQLADMYVRTRRRSQ